MQVRFPGTFRALSTCRGSAIPIEATYRRVILLDATPCPKTGLFQPSINLSADHETGLAEPKLRQPRPKENPPKENPRKAGPAESRPHGTPNAPPTKCRRRAASSLPRRSPPDPRRRASTAARVD